MFFYLAEQRLLLEGTLVTLCFAPSLSGPQKFRPVLTMYSWVGRDRSVPNTSTTNDPTMLNTKICFPLMNHPPFGIINFPVNGFQKSVSIGCPAFGGKAGTVMIAFGNHYTMLPF